MNFSFASFLNLLQIPQIIEQSFSYLLERFLMTRKAWVQNWYEKVSETLITVSLGINFEETLTSLAIIPLTSSFKTSATSLVMQLMLPLTCSFNAFYSNYTHSKY